MMTEAMNVDSLYQEIILDHYKRPHGAGLRDGGDAEVHHVNPTCGDEITLRVHLDGDVVRDVSYDAQGCSISQARIGISTQPVRVSTVRSRRAGPAPWSWRSRTTAVPVSSTWTRMRSDYALWSVS